MNTRLPECVISGFRREVEENCALVGYYAVRSSNLLPKFWDNLRSYLWRRGPIGCPETSIINGHFSLHSNQEDGSSQPGCGAGGQCDKQITTVLTTFIINIW